MLACQVPTCAGATIRTVRRPALLPGRAARRRHRAAVRRVVDDRRRQLADASRPQHRRHRRATAIATDPIATSWPARRLTAWIDDGRDGARRRAVVDAVSHGVHRRGRAATRHRRCDRCARGGRRGRRRSAAPRTNDAEGQDRPARPHQSDAMQPFTDLGPVVDRRAHRPADRARRAGRSCVDENGVVHRVERIVDPDRLAAIAAAVAPNPVLIADGHHRYAISRTYRDEVREATGRTRHRCRADDGVRRRTGRRATEHRRDPSRLPRHHRRTTLEHSIGRVLRRIGGRRGRRPGSPPRRSIAARCAWCARTAPACG